MTTGKTTWLTPAADAWEAKMGAGTFPSGQAARFLKPLTVAGHEMETIGLHLTEYLTRTSPQFVSIARFAMTFAQWAPKTPVPPKEEESLVDEHGVLRV